MDKATKHKEYWVRVRLETKLAEKKGKHKNGQRDKTQTILGKSNNKGESGCELTQTILG